MGELMQRFCPVILLSCFLFTQALAGNLAIGDSNTAGLAASVPANAWVAKTAGGLGISIPNGGVSGDMAANLAPRVYGIASGAGDLYFLQTGENDNRAYTTDPAKRAIYDLEIAAEAAWLALPAKQPASGCTRGGTWASTVVWSGINSVHAGDFVECTVSGTSAFVWMVQQDNTDAGFQVTVDGVVKDTGNTKSAGLGPTYNAQSPYGPMYWGPMLRQIDGLAAGSHAVRVTITSIGTNGKVYVDAMAGNAQAANPPRVFVLDIFRCQVYAAGVSDAVVADYNATLAARAATLQAAGLAVAIVDVASVINPATDEDGGCHAVDAGHAKEASAVIAAVNGPPPPPPAYSAAVIEMDAANNFYGRLSTDSAGTTRRQLH